MRTQHDAWVPFLLDKRSPCGANICRGSNITGSGCNSKASAVRRCRSVPIITEGKGKGLSILSERRCSARLATGAAALSCTLVAGCVTGRDSPAPALLEANKLTASRALASAKMAEEAWPQDDWWRAYGDPQLDSLEIWPPVWR
jgi:hypothetical protein